VSARRFSRLVVSVRLADVEHARDGRPRWKPGSDEELIRVGGCWDARLKRWVRAKSKGALVLRFHRGQEEAARFFADWLRRFASGDWTDVERVWSAMLIGGRRSGKTHIACAVMIAFAVMVPRARLWAISPTLETGDELDQAFRELIPRQWYRRTQARTGHATTYKFANGSVLHLKSAVNPARLKAGRVDIALLNEGQEISHKAYEKLRAAVADRGGIVLITANPPDRPVGKWIEDHYNKTVAGEIASRAFVLDPRNNPWINFEALRSMAAEVDDKTMQRDVLGLFAPIGDIVFHEWDDRVHWKNPPEGLVDVTPIVSRRELGHGAGDLVGEDFQRLPSMVGIVLRVLRDPATGIEMLWVVDEAVVDESDEGGLCDALEGIRRWQFGDGPPSRRDAERPTYRGWKESDDSDMAPSHAAVIMDASGFWQDGEHKVNRSSEKWLRARRWVHLFRPQKDSDKNPAIIERITRTGNALLKQRRLFVARHCSKTAEAMRLYENKNGSPNRRSVHAHIVDGVTYPAYRLYGRPKAAQQGGYKSAGKFSRGAELVGL
jgi:hypothetical protein